MAGSAVREPMEEIADAPGMRSPRRDAWRRLRGNPIALASLILLGLLIFAALAAPLIATHSVAEMGFARAQPPGDGHLLGTDQLGRDLWSRLVHGSRVSLTVALGSQAIAVTIGIVVGSLAGMLGKVGDAVLMRLTDVMLALPPLLLALLLLTVFGRGVAIVTIAIGLATWPSLARLVRGQVLHVKSNEYVHASRGFGAPLHWIVRRHLLPNIMSPLVIQLLFTMSQAILAEAFLSFIGLGSQPPTPSWGLLLSDGHSYIRVAPHLVLFPALILSFTLLALNSLGDGLRDALDPRYTR